MCCVVVVSLHPSPFPLRSVALLPALPDVFLRVPREVEVQSPVRLPLGDRGHFRPRDTPHIHRDILPEEAVATHLVICQGRHHLVNIPAGRHNFVFMNVHFEPELTLRQLHVRLSLLYPDWLGYPLGVEFFLGDLTFSIRKKDDVMFGTKHSPMTTPGKTAMFHSFSVRL